MYKTIGNKYSLKAHLIIIFNALVRKILIVLRDNISKLLMRYFFTCFILVFCWMGLSAQADSLLLMNGKYKAGSVDSVSALSIHYSLSGKSKKMPLSKVYSYSLNEQKTILYKDRSIDYLTQEQMRTLITGKQIGMEKYDNRVIMASGFLLSLASSLFDTYESVSDSTFTSPQLSSNRFFQREPTFAQLVMPLSFTFSITSFRPKMKAEHVSNASYLENELILEGFQAAARRKQLYGAAFSSLAGTLTGIVSYLIFKP